MTLVQFIKKYNRTKVDWDNSFGAQCVDLYRQYLNDVLKIPQTPATGDSGAKAIYENHGALVKTDTLAPGDVLVYSKTDTNEYGHVCILVALLDSKTFVVFEQDGFKQDGAKLALRTADNLLGGLRKAE